MCGRTEIVMKGLTTKNLIELLEGKYYGPEDEAFLNTEVTGVFTDSRKVTEGSLFIPIVGERVDGHDFIPSVFDKKAKITLSEKELKDSCGPYILIKSSLQALKDIAEFYLKQLDVKVVGITGSVGKTSTKEMVSSVLSQQFKVLKTDGNFNNEIGLPLTVFRLTGEEDIAVLEMGISDFNEMSRLTKIARPDVALITNIGMCHLENLKTRDGILKAKTEIFEGLKAGGTICLNGDDDKLSTVTSYKDSRIVFFGKDIKNEIYASDIQSLGLKGTKCQIHTPNGSFSVKIPVPGIHMVSNALAACAVGLTFGMTSDKIAKGIEALQPVNGRVNMIETSDFTIIDDCYNANPVSMKSSIDILKDAIGRKVCILGDMFELGENQISLHEEVGTYVKESDIDLLIAIGDLSKAIFEGAKSGKCECHHFNSKEEAFLHIPHLLHKKDSILVKASHGMEFADVVEFLKKM